MRILMILCDFRTGGAEKAALDLVGALVGRGHEFTVAPTRSGGELGRCFAQAGGEVVGALARWRFDPLAPFRVAGIIRRRSIEAMIIVDAAGNALFAGLVGAAVSRRRVARICWCHSIPGGQGGNVARRLRNYRAMGMLDVVVCLSRHHRRVMTETCLPVRRATPRRMPVIANAVDLEQFAGATPTDLQLPAGKRIIVQVANVMPDKDFDTLLAAAGILAQKRDDFHFVLVGRDTDSPEITAAVDRSGAGGFVTLAGLRQDVPSILAASDIFVLSTRREVFPLSVLEAFAAAVPAVVSDIPAFDEMLIAGCEGLKTPPGNPAAFASAISRLLDDEPLRIALAENARMRAESFSPARMGRSFDRLLRAAVSNARKR